MNDWLTLEAVADGWTQGPDGQWVAPFRERPAQDPTEPCRHCFDPIGDYPSQSGCCLGCDQDFYLALDLDPEAA